MNRLELFIKVMQNFFLLSFLLSTFDLIYSFGVIHHSPRPSRIFSEMKKYMNENTVVKVMLYAKDSWKNYMIEAGLGST